MKSFIQKIILLTILCLGLQGCLVLVGGAAVGTAGALVVYDRRDIKTIMSDEKISRQILFALQANDQIKQQCHIVISTYRGIVLLAGQAPTQELKQSAEKIAKTTAGTQRLYDEITIEGPTSALTRTSDSWITIKVKTKLIDTPGLKSGEFKVVTENGTVYLMGVVSKSHSQIATNAIKTVGGVQKVVTIFQYQQNIDPEISAIDEANTAAETQDNSTLKKVPTTTKSPSNPEESGRTEYIGI